MIIKCICGKRFRCKEGDTGKQFDCTGCSTKLTIRHPAPVQPSPKHKLDLSGWPLIAVVSIAILGITAVIVANSATPDTMALTICIAVCLVALAIAAVALYLLPAIIAWRGNHPHLLPILALNILLGWSLAGWAGALIWSLIPVREPSAARLHPN